MTLGFAALLSFSSCEKEGLSEGEVVDGLKTALRVGTDSSATRLNKRDGFFKDAAIKILLPPEASVIYNNLGFLGAGGQLVVDKAVESLNRAAEDAALEAKPIFINAIIGMTISDAFGILNGDDLSATNYLKSKTYADLQTRFEPKIYNSLNKPLLLGESTESIYAGLITAYNTPSLGGLLYPQITDNTLASHATRKALDGLFAKVGEEEQLIRHDPAHRVSEILVKVFGSIK